MAHKNKDYEFVLESFLDILDYDQISLDQNLYNIVLLSNKKFAQDKLLKELIEVIFYKLNLNISIKFI